VLDATHHPPENLTRAEEEEQGNTGMSGVEEER